MSDIRIVMEYPHPIENVWLALTDPDLIPKWTATGQAARPEGFRPVVGNRFRYVGKPVPGWDGVVECEVRAVEAPRMLRYTWVGGSEDPSIVTYSLEPSGQGTRFAYEHTGFRGIGGFFMSKLLGRVRRKMLSVGMPAVLEQLACGTSGPAPPSPAS